MNDANASDANPSDGAPDPGAAAAAATPTDPTAWREMARAGRFDEAERLRALAVAAGAEPDDEDERDALRSLAAIQASLRAKAWRTAERRASDADADAWPSWVEGARVATDVTVLAASGAALERRDVGAAVEALQPLHDLPPGPFEAERLTQLGTARVLDAKDDEARRCFDQALERDPAHPRALVNLGNVALEAGEVDEAITLYQAALKVDEDFANAHHNLGVAYRRKGMIGKSVASLRRAQRAERRRDAREAREDVRGLGGGATRRPRRWLPWIVGAAVLIGWFFLR